MGRIAAGVEYDGSEFAGWQYQNGQRTVQDCLQTALSSIANHPVSVITAGRTDAGVHAACQVVHFDVDADRKPYQWLRGTNTLLPDDISLLWLKETAEDFHARFTAINRSYRYIVLNRPTSPALYHGKVGWDRRSLDDDIMRAACAPLIGVHDFSSFRASGCQAKSPVRNLERISIGRFANWIWFDMVANAFLQHMVRNIVGTLIAVGAGERSVQWPEEVLRARDRRLAGVTAPPDGLYLTSISYPERYRLPADVAEIRYW